MNRLRITPARRRDSSGLVQRLADGLRVGLGFGLGIGMTLALPAHAALPEPDGILWGTVSLQGIPITAARTDVLLEARDTVSGAVLASYRMGASPAAGNHYLLRIPVQSDAPPPFSPLAARLGSTIRIEVASALQPLGQQPVSMTARGQFQRLDLAFGPGHDPNGLPDPWEREYFGAAGQDPEADPDGDGRTTREEFEAGTHPNRADPAPGLSIARVDGWLVIEFLAAAATGPGYQGYQRRFTLESAPALAGASTAWSPAPGVHDLPATDQAIQVSLVNLASSQFYRLRLRLVRIE